MKIVPTFQVLPICGPARLPTEILSDNEGMLHAKPKKPPVDTMTAGTGSISATPNSSLHNGIQTSPERIRALVQNGDEDSLESLVSIGEPAVSLLARYLNSEHFKTATEVLGKIGGESARDNLTDVALDDSNREAVRVAAIQALGKIGDEEAKEVLIALLEDEDTQEVEVENESANTEIRKEAARTVGKIGGQWARKALIERLADHLPDVRIVVLESLAHMIDDQIEDDQRVRSVVIKYASPGREKIPAVRGEAIQSLGASKEPRAVVDVVIKALIDNDWLVAPQARKILLKWGSEVRDALSEFHDDESNDPKLREEVAAILKEIDAS